jgi:hypothetical protein
VRTTQNGKKHDDVIDGQSYRDVKNNADNGWGNEQGQKHNREELTDE